MTEAGGGSARHGTTGPGAGTAPDVGWTCPTPASAGPRDHAARRELLESRYETFQHLVDQADAHLAQGRYAAAATQAAVAATYAVWKHPGLFVSPRLERILLAIGRRGIHALPVAGRRAVAPRTPERVLHVATQAFGIGGLTRMIWRWIGQDTGRTHSIVLTRQGEREIPQVLMDRARASGGDVHVLNRSAGTMLSWAATLRHLSTSADVVVVHLNEDDVLPSITFADKQHTPPVIFVDLADHAFWLGTGIADVLASLRSSGYRLAMERRGIEPARASVLPIILDPIERSIGRPEAKAQLGVDNESLILLSIARAHKYRDFHGQSFVDGLLPILDRYPKARLLVVGPDHQGSWERAAASTSGRVRAFGPRDDTALFLQAADVYIDSYPITSTTSLLEAGGYGLPVVSRCAYEADCSVLCVDSPGIDEHIIRAHHHDDYVAAIASLLDDESLRMRLGERMRASIEKTHMGAGWQAVLEDVYTRAMALPPVESPTTTDRCSTDALEVLTADLHGNDATLDQMVALHCSGFPLGLRWAWLYEQARAGRPVRPSLLLPEWLAVRSKLWIRRGLVAQRIGREPAPGS